MNDERTYVSVVGPGRSGTTILGAILGEVPTVACPGELRWLWRRGVLEGRRCGCGQLITECPIWAHVLEYADAPSEDGALRERAQRVAAWQSELALMKNRRRVLASAGGTTPTGWQALDAYTTELGRAVNRLYDVTGAGVIVDTSKRAIDAAVVSRLPDVRHVVVQIVRDPRAVAYSWQRVKHLPENDKATPMGTRGPWSSLRTWIDNCTSAEYLHRNSPGTPWLFIRYEDFVSRPHQTLDQMLDLMGVDPTTNPVSVTGTVDLGANHTVAGNPDRFRTGSVTVRPDDEWRKALSQPVEVALGMGALPLMRRYGYPVNPR